MSSFASLFEINGVVDTSRNVYDNLNTLATASGCFLTWDVSLGKWSIVINKPASSSFSFNDTNIIGGINVSGSGIRELYNAVSIEFPHKDLRDTTDYIDLKIPDADRYPQEVDNTLKITLDCINNPVQAQNLATRELKQSRLDKIVNFVSDYTANGVVAGMIVDITNSAYDWTNKLFRIIEVSEEDGDDGSLLYSITALEYDNDLYDTSGLVREYRSKETGIVASLANTTIINQENAASLKVEVAPETQDQGISLTYLASTGAYILSQSGTTLRMPNGSTDLQNANVIIKWTFDDGKDLDIRARLYDPYLNQATVDDALGYSGSSSTTQWPAVNPIIFWGGDNTGTGVESVLVDLSSFYSQYPTNRYCIIQTWANWYTHKLNGTQYDPVAGTPEVTVGARPVRLSASIYVGGTVTAGSFTWTSAGHTVARELDGVSVYINSDYGAEYTGADWASKTLVAEPGATQPGDSMGYLVIDMQEGTAVFTNNVDKYYD